MADIAKTVTLVVTIVDAILAIAAVIGALYVWNVYRQRHENALFLERLVHRDIRVGVGGAVIFAYIVGALNGFSFGPPWGALIISIAVGLMLVGPADDAVLWFRERRRVTPRESAFGDDYDWVNDPDGRLDQNGG